MLMLRSRIVSMATDVEIARELAEAMRWKQVSDGRWEKSDGTVMWFGAIHLNGSFVWQVIEFMESQGKRLSIISYKDGRDIFWDEKGKTNGINTPIAEPLTPRHIAEAALLTLKEESH